MRRGLAHTICLLVLLWGVQSLYAQREGNDTISQPQAPATNPKIHSPQRATLYSALLPGLGQAYNKKYWKIPIIYAGFAGTGYLIATNHKEYRKFVDAYQWIDTGSQGAPPNDYAVRYPSKDQLLKGQYQYRRSLELSIILTTLWYGLNIVDATVDAHFFNFDIDEELTLQWYPAIVPTWQGDYQTGVALRLNF
ncbi:MAG: hypothetical protein CSA95_07710 [Bacteroidetes bacterium]|nr:MAG: hypothetical protein CSA95_07710 [Bacteroidota bacterium]PIE88057.1 MAG: hypothetical protein CSA04_03855 [Bacteroidota bacterium]